MDTSHGPAGERMGQVATRINRELAQFCELLSEADKAQEWLADGSPTPQQWLNARFGIDPKQGRRLVRLANRLEDLPKLRKRFAVGDLSLDEVDTLAEVATPETEVDLIERADGRDLHGISRLTSHVKPPTREEAADARKMEWLSTQWDLHRRRMAVRGEFSGVHGHIVEERLVAGAKMMPKSLENGQYEEWNKRMADSLVELCATDSDAKTPIPTLVVNTEASALENPFGQGVTEISCGPVISNELARMLGCDSHVEPVITLDGRPMGIGRKSRKIPGWLRRQVIARDHHCQAPGCGRTAFLQIHHRQAWAEGGATDLDNLVLMCWWHHIFIHENGWHITRDPDGHFVFRKPDWSPYPRRPT